MKKFILLLNVVFIISNSFSQDFVKEGKQWNVSETMNFGGTVTLIYKIEGDSVTENLQYKKVWVCSDSLLTDCLLFGLIREDAGKVFFQPNYSNKESLLYDFNIGIGDTVQVLSLPNQGDCEVVLICIGVDTMTYLGIPRKTWSFASYDSEGWVEGIGNLHGLFQNRYYECILDVDFSLLCAYDGDSLIYQNSPGNPCYINTVGIGENPFEAQISIFPNPVIINSKFKIKSKKRISRVEIYGAGGKLRFQMHDISKRELTIQSKNLNKGFFLLYIKTDDNQVYTGKLVIY